MSASYYIPFGLRGVLTVTFTSPVAGEELILPGQDIQFRNNFIQKAVVLALQVNEQYVSDSIGVMAVPVY